MRACHLILTLLLQTAIATLADRDTCGTGFSLCAPAGATSIATPQIGSPDFPSLFVDLVSSSLPSSSSKRGVLARTTPSSLCCNALLSCLLMSNLALPFCYDKFTTNYRLPDGAAGTIVGGAYTSATGDTANLETGDFVLANGTTGNIYAANPALKPNTATLPMPSQFTASGVGSAVPASSLGFVVTTTYTTTLPGTTVLGTTVSASTLPGKVITETVLLPTTVSTQISSVQVLTVVAVTSYSQVMVQGSVVPGTTVLGTTVEPKVLVITTTQAVASLPSSSAAASTSKKGGAESRKVAALSSVGFGGIMVWLAGCII